MRNKMLPESVLPDQERISKYKSFAVLFSYPDDAFFAFFPQLSKQREKIAREYDTLFRNRDICLYTAEYTNRSIFQKSNQLADIMGFYKAFGLALDEERPDALFIEFEFMHYMIFKGVYAAEKKLTDAKEKRAICFDAQKKFFDDHLYPGAQAIAEKIMAVKEKFMYKDFTRAMLDLLDDEKKYFDSRGGLTPIPSPIPS